MTVTEPHDNPGLLMPPPFFLGIAFLAALLLDWMTGWAFLSAPINGSAQFWVGLLLCAAAVGLAVAGFREFTKSGTNVDPFEPALKLVTTGPYRFTRNPMYLGMLLMLIGLSMVFSLEWGLLLAPILWLAFDRLVVAREEAYLTRKFGEPYRAFLKRTRRWM